MKLYNRNEFIKLPANTIYSRVDDRISSKICHGLFCKISGDEWDVDWIEQDLIGEGKAPDHLTSGIDIVDYVLAKRDNFESFDLDYNLAGRDGLFNDKDAFVVWEKKDIRKLIDYLKTCEESVFDE